MSGSSRKKLDIDYNIFSKTGKKVEKVRDMAEKLKIASVNINSDVEDFFESYLLEQLTDEDEIRQYVNKLENLKLEHRRIHAQIKEKDSEKFQNLYPNYEQQKIRLAEAFENAKQLVTQIRKEKNGKLQTENKFKANLEIEKIKQETAKAELENERIKQEKLKYDLEVENLKLELEERKAKANLENEKLRHEKEKADIENEKLRQEKEKAALELETLKLEVETKKAKSNSELTQKREKLKCEFHNYVDKVYEKNGEFSWESCLDINEISDLLATLETDSEKFDRIYSDLVGAYHGKSGEFSEKRDFFFKMVRESISNGKCRINELKARERIFKEEKSKHDDELRISQILSNAKHLFSEIKGRFETLCEKCEIKITELGDHELLNLQKREDHFNLELREFREKVTEFSQFVSSCPEKVERMCEETISMREALNRKVTFLFEETNRLILKNDISEEKLRNAAKLKIDLERFSGYESNIDIYTFKEEFKKLIEPTVQKKLLPDYLKKNYLCGSAYTLVAKLNEVETIWEKLINVFGNTHLLLQNKLSTLEKFSHLGKLKDDEKVVFALSELLNIMEDLSNLALTYKLEGNLYYGGGLQRILKLIGEYRKRNFLRSIAKENLLDDKEKWKKLVSFLEDERTEREIFLVNEKTEKSMVIESKAKSREEDSTKREANNRDPKFNKQWKDKRGYLSQMEREIEQKWEKVTPKCYICDTSDSHVVSLDEKGVLKVEYIACKKIVEMNPFERMKTLNKEGLCVKCLKPGVKRDSNHECDDKYVCKKPFKNKFGKSRKCLNHILVCGFHAKEKTNMDLIAEFRKEFIIKNKNKFDKFSQEVSISLHTGSQEFQNHMGKKSDEERDKLENAIFKFQTIEIKNVKFNLFFDSGCGDLVITKSAVDNLIKLNRAKQIAPGPMVLTGVGDVKSVCKYGAYSITLPLEKGDEATMSGICLERITAVFPLYTLKTVEEEFCDEITRDKREFIGELPSLPSEVGGEVDIIIGIQYLKYFPEKVVGLDSGLTLYRSVFKSFDSSNGIIAGPHRDFTKTNQSTHFYEKSIYINPIVEEYNEHIKIRNEIPLLGQKTELYDCNNNFYGVNKKRAPKVVKVFDEIEHAGTEITYRCLDCRDCLECKRGSSIEAISIQEEAEQHIINKSVSVDFKNRTSTARLPFLLNPDVRLVSNKNIARKVYNGQLKKLINSSEDRKAVIDSENKLQRLGYVDYVSNLNESNKGILESVNYYIPWRIAWNTNSISTPARLVFDASQRTASGYSLNDLLTKGENNMNNLIQILIRWTTKLWAFHTDVQKMYNAVQLEKSHWRYQLYLWEQNLDPKKEPVTKVIKTLIYGVKPSGNQAGRALRLTAENSVETYPKASKIILDDVYVDDCMSGTDTKTDLMTVTDDLKFVLETGGFTLKGFTFSRKDPDEHLSADGQSINVGGLKWFTKSDQFAFNINTLNFEKKVRGRKDCKGEGILPDTLTKRDCVSRVAELFDPLGRLVPLIASMKQDISLLHSSGLDWDDKIPDNLRSIWKSNFEFMEEIRNVRYSRAIVPSDAKSLDIHTIGTGDASQKVICAAIYARFEKKDGTFSCQLIFARSKILTDGISTPRAELMAAVLNASTGHVVERALAERHKKTLKLTDSQVTLYWISSKRTALKTWVRNRVIEINRLTETAQWHYVESSNMIADIGTRKGVGISDVIQDSAWINGLDWMNKEEKGFPIFSVEEIKLDKKEVEDLKREKIYIEDKETKVLFCRIISDKVKERYAFSNYLIDPNKYRFRKVVRVLAFVLTFIRNISKNVKVLRNIFDHTYPGEVPEMFQSIGDKYVLTTNSVKNMGSMCPGGKVIDLADNMLKSAMFYFSWKATLELKQFVDKRKYVNITKEIDRVLYYSGRLLDDYALDGYPELCSAAIDLSPTTFCVPVMDQYSPVAYAIAMEVHWYHPDVNHKGVESLLRQSEGIAHIIGGRDLTKEIKWGCKKCRILHKKSVEVMMGPIQNVNLCIAPCFYATQVDIFGPLKSYSSLNKRASMKVWFLVFCCCTTGAVDVHLMDDYSTTAFIQAFVRFSCRFGYPKVLLPDEGSQLVKGCEDMVYSFTDTKLKLSVEYGVEFIPCPVGAHYVHGKVERKIRQIKECLKTNLNNERLSVIQWETLMQQISNSINNLPIGVKNKVEAIENLDIITPNRLILGRNNNRCPNKPLEISNDYKKIIHSNNEIFRGWFKAWLTSYVPSLIERPKWHKSDRRIKIGDVILFLKSEREYDLQYQYGIVNSICQNKDGQVRRVTIEYKNHHENCRRSTQHGV